MQGVSVSEKVMKSMKLNGTVKSQITYLEMMFIVQIMEKILWSKMLSTIRY